MRSILNAKLAAGLAVLAAALYLVWLIDLDSLWERFNSGTTKGFHFCKKAGLKQALSENTIQRFCIRRHQQDINARLEGKAGYQNTPMNPYSFSGSVTNFSDDVIITEFTVSVTHKNSGAHPPDTKAFSEVWIEPKASASFVISPDELGYKPPINEGQNGKYDWQAVNLRGIRISF